MKLIRPTGLAITAKEFKQWLTPLLEHPQCLQHRAGADANADTMTADRQLTQDLGIAVSGGVDSMALVTLLSRHYASHNASNPRLHALIVDHKLRDNSTEEANFVAIQVRDFGVTPHVLTLDWRTSNSGHSYDSINHSHSDKDGVMDQKPDKVHLETRARLERYKAIAQKCHALQIRNLFVGHHAGDQVETVLFRFSRASGIEGLAGIQGRASPGVLNVPEALGLKVIRPLLTVSKDRLRATCEDAGTQWVEDPSNRSLDYQRNVIRHYQQHIDSLVTEQGPLSKLYPLSTPALLAFRDRMDRHRRAVWNQVRPWLKDIKFDSANGVCHVKMQVPQALDATIHLTSAHAPDCNIEWLQESRTHVAARLLSFIVRWISCKDHSPRLEGVQTLLKHLRQPASAPSRAVENQPFHETLGNTSTVYRRRKQRALKNSQLSETKEVMDDIDKADKEGLITPFFWHPLSMTGVLFSPPRKTRGIQGHWTISRQPMSSAERIAASILVSATSVKDRDSQKEQEATSVLWDNRFFIEIRSNDTVKVPQIRIRPMAMNDAQSIRQKLSAQEHSSTDQLVSGLENLERWMADVPGNARFTLPAIVVQDPASSETDPTRETILSLPTLGINLMPSQFTIACRFKSSALIDDMDACERK
ncbi:hypothetical protein BGZ51_002916 [Haplosporangium sp. Z 767]|nr:hypothetical protein BGZ51_002916 [Haplosporangium sp. Z 767]KAF9185944.1 hypothetical protein BGZ50_002789 [Haplosporangium sp. Z 11]